MPQKAWSAKRERQYVHIKESLLERGKPEPLAEEIAARVVGAAAGARIEDRVVEHCSSFAMRPGNVA